MLLNSFVLLDTRLAQGIAIWVGVVLVAFLIGKFVPQRRYAIRQVVVPALLVTALELIVGGLPDSLLGATPRGAMVHAAWMLTGVLTINGVGLLIFDLLLPRFIPVSRIAHELSVGLGYLVLILFFLRRFGVDFSSLLATSAVVTAIVAISMQATLGNAFGGLTLQLDRSISEGEWLRLDDGTEGLVRSVRWRHTVIETRNWDTVIIPNSMLMAQKFLILGKREGHPQQHRMWVYFNVDFRTAPAEVIQAVEDGLRSAPILGVATSPPANCVCMDFVQPESSARYAVRYWLSDLAQDDPTNSRIRSRIYAALRRAKIPLAVPAAKLFVENHDQASSNRKAARKLQRRLEAVRRMSLCQGLTAAEQEQVAQSLKYVPYASGEVISREGASAHWLYLLDRGSVDIHILFDGEDQLLNSLHAPDFFGEHGMLTGAKRTATVIAASEVECFRLDRETFDELLQSRPEIASDLATVLAQRQEEMARFKEHLDSGERLSRAERHRQILDKMQAFFGLSSSDD